MKKLILILIFLTTAFAGYSQRDSVAGKKDTLICVTPTELRNAVKTSDSLAVAKKLIQEQEKTITLQKELSEKDKQLIQESARLNDANKFIIANLDKQVNNLTTTNRLMLDNEAYLKNRLLLQKRKTFFITSAFVTVIGSAVYFLAR